jgi:hypothetical protein
VFTRGFVEALSLTPTTFAEKADPLFRAAPLLRSVDFSVDSDAELCAIVACPQLARLDRLSCKARELTHETVARLVSCPHLHRLSGQLLTTNVVSSESVRLLADAPLLGKLTSLTITTRLPLWGLMSLGTALDGAAMRTLASSPRCKRLGMLALDYSGIGDSVAEALASSPSLAELWYLSLAGNGITEAGAEALATTQRLPKLKYVYLIGNPLSEGSKRLLRERFGDGLYLGV